MAAVARNPNPTAPTGYVYKTFKEIDGAKVEAVKAAILNAVNSEEISKTQSLTVGELEEYLKDDSATHYSHVVLKGEELAGAIIARPGDKAIGNKQADLKKPMTIENIFVFEAHKKNKSGEKTHLGQGLMHKVMVKAKSNQDGILLTIFQVNEKAQEFFVRQGFTYPSKQADIKAGYDCFLMKLKFT